MDYTTLTIETERLRLIPVDGRFREEVFREFDENITQYMYPKPNETIEALDKVTKENIQEMKDETDFNFYVTDKYDATFLGRGGLHKINTKTPEFGIWLKKSAHGNAYGREAMHAIKKWANEHLDYEYLMYPVDKRNVASRKIAESLNGKIMKEYKQINMAGKELDEVEYHIYPSK